MVRRIGIDIPTQRLVGFCRKWKVMEMVAEHALTLPDEWRYDSF